MKTYTIVGGVNGVGKSSFTGVMKERTNDLGVIIDVDKITAEMGGSARAGGTVAIQKINECLEQGLSLTQETTLSDISVKQIVRAKELGYHVRLFYIGLDTEKESLIRIVNRVNKGGRDVPDEDVLRQFANRWEPLTKVLFLCDEAEFYDNDNGFVKVGEYQERRFVLKNGAICPKWIGELERFLRDNTDVQIACQVVPNEQTRLAIEEVKRTEENRCVGEEYFDIDLFPSLKEEIIEGMETPLSECVPESEVEW